MKPEDAKVGAKVKALPTAWVLSAVGNVGTIQQAAQFNSLFVNIPNTAYPNGFFVSGECLELVDDPVVPVPEGRSLLPTAPAKRKTYPIATGVLDYFPAALLEVAKVSYQGNQQHNPGQPLHWARGKSTDQDDTVLRHFLERGSVDVDGMRHSAKMCWRALAILQLELEAEGAPIARGAK
jgi:hypothetical protein